jgi:hypothetical protein
MDIKKLLINTLLAEYRVTDEVRNLKTEYVVMCCLLRGVWSSDGIIINPEHRRNSEESLAQCHVSHH